MIRAYDEIVDFLAAGVTSAALARFEASTETKERLEVLLRKEKLGGLSFDEMSELNHFMTLEHVMRLAKARARIRTMP